MDKTSDLIDTSTYKKRPIQKPLKHLKPYKSFLCQAGKVPQKSKLPQKSSQKSEITPFKTRPSLYKENSTTKDSESLSQVNRSKLSRQSTLKKKPSKQVKLKNRFIRGKSLGETNKKSSLKVQRSNSRPTLKAQVSVSTLKVLDMNKKMTPRSTHPSPQHSHRTPDSIRISQGQNLPTLTEKKSKIPEIGYYCKRFSLFDKNKPLYKDSPDLSIDKQDFPKLCFDNPFTFPSEPSVTAKSFQSDTGCLLPEKDLNNFQRIQSLSPQGEKDKNFESPTRLIKVYSSPEGKMIKKTLESPKTPKNLNSPVRSNEPRAPRKTFADFDSPGSFVFSISSNSSDERIGQDFSWGQANVRNRKNFQKDEESQTDLTEFVADSQVVAGLKLIGKLSEIMDKSRNIS
jgi:hypothetical protein